MRRLLIGMFFLGVLLQCPFLFADQGALDVGVTQPNAKLTYQPLEEGKLLVSVTDEQENPIRGLTAEHFSIRGGNRQAKIVQVEPLETNKEIGLNIVMVIDNSFSMQQRNAVIPLTRALEALYKTLRPIDQVIAVVFDGRKTVQVNGRALHAKSFQAGTVAQLREFVSDSLGRGLTHETYLHDAMVVGLEAVRSLPEQSNKFMVVFSDGEDLNSALKQADVEKAAQGIGNFSAYAVDYMPTAQIDPFLNRFATTNNGRIWKASNSDELLPVFEAFSSILLHRYVVTYRFIEAPTGSVAFNTPELTIEEITTIDSSPLLNYIFFETGQSELSPIYSLFKDQNATATFAEENLRGAMEKYSHVLNVIGKRLQQNPDAAVRLVGCNANIGEEKGRTDLSLRRAEAVKAYLRYVWQIDTQRLTVETRNLPAAPASNRTPQGQAENRRVEIYSDHPAILATVDSEYVQKVSNQQNLRIVPAVQSEAGIADWRVTLQCAQQVLQTFEGKGDLPPQIEIPLESAMLDEISTCESVSSSIQAVDKEANPLKVSHEESLPIRYLQRKTQMAEVQGYKVKEQYALILFDYDSSAIKGRNEAIVARIVKRIQDLPQALVSVVGHTDILGTEAYNMTLSQKRAEAVRAEISKTAAVLGDRLHVSGVGPNAPLFDNETPQGRSLNRTVTITLEYLQQNL